MVLCQLLFCVGKAGPHRKLTFGSVVVEHPAARFQIIDLAGVQHLHSPAGQLQHDLPAAPPLHPLDGAGKPDAQLFIRHRLEHIIHRIHGITPDGVLCHVGHEHKHRLLIHCPDALRCRKAIQLRHLHIQKDDVIPAAVLLHELRTIRKGRHFGLDALLGSVLPDKLLHPVPGLFLVFDHCDSEHAATPPSISCFLSL